MAAGQEFCNTGHISRIGHHYSKFEHSVIQQTWTFSKMLIFTTHFNITINQAQITLIFYT